MGFLSEAVTPVVETIVDAEGQKPELVWQQFGGLIGMLLDLAENGGYPEALIRNVRYPIKLLSESVAPEVFHTRRNPFTPKLRYVENPCKPEERWVMRSSCCHYDCRVDGEKCYVCPKLTPEERDVMKERLLLLRPKE
jgi:Uncharacterized Fe-S protein